LYCIFKAITFRYSKHAPIILFPVFELQLKLRRKVLGLSAWERMASRRTEAITNQESLRSLKLLVSPKNKNAALKFIVNYYKNSKSLAHHLPDYMIFRTRKDATVDNRGVFIMGDLTDEASFLVRRKPKKIENDDSTKTAKIIKPEKSNKVHPANESDNTSSSNHRSKHEEDKLHKTKNGANDKSNGHDRRGRDDHLKREDSAKLIQAVIRGKITRSKLGKA
jgi:hypothetical protein